MKRVAALLFALGIATLVRADVGPPPGKKDVLVTTIVEATEAFPDYAFFEVSFSSRPGPPPHGGSSTSTTYHFFVPGTTIKATGDRRHGGGLYAVPKAVVEKNAGWKLFAGEATKQSPPKHLSISTFADVSALRHSVIKGEVPGGTSIRFGGSEQLPTSDPRTAISETYQIVRTSTGVAFVRPSDTPRVDGDRGNDGSESAISWRWVVVGGVGSLALLLGGCGWCGVSPAVRDYCRCRKQARVGFFPTLVALSAAIRSG